MIFYIRRGSYWLQGENGWGPFVCARRFAVEREAKQAGSKLTKSTDQWEIVALPNDYEECRKCGYSHAYAPEEAWRSHQT